MRIKLKPILLLVFTIVISFCAGSMSMYYFIQKRASYMSQGVFIDENRDMAKFGIHSGEDYSEKNPYNYVPVDWLIKEIEIDAIKDIYEKHKSEDVQRFLQLAESGNYTIYSFSNNITMWYQLAGVEGYCLVDKSKNRLKEWVILTGFITSMS